MSFIEILKNEEGKSLIEQIEELAETQEPTLIRIRKNLIKELKKKFGYEY